MLPNILILGGTGTVGIELINLLNKNFNIYSTYRNKKKIRKIKNVNWINDKKIKLLKKIKFRFLINCIAVHSFSNKKKISDYVESNIYYLLTYLKIINKNTDIINLSTISKFNLKNKRINEDSPYSFDSPLSITKNSLDKILKFQEKKYINLLLPGILSKNEDFKRPVLKKIIYNLKKNRKITLYNKSILFNSFIDVYEIYKFIKHLYINKLPITSGDYILAPDPKISLNFIVNHYFDFYQSKSKIIDNGNDKKNYILSNNKLKKNFHYNVSEPLTIIERFKI